MKVPNVTLQYVKCAKCHCFLSRGPVYMQPYGVTVCYKCFNPLHPGARIICYEALAKLLTFPCCNVNFGCKETVPFAPHKQSIPHEELCPFRRYKCVLQSSKCTWLGIRTDILQHCLQKHRTKVHDNPVQLQYDNISSTKTYLVRAFQELFLLYVKISIPENKVYHNLRFLGYCRNVKRYEYVLSIKMNEEEQLTKIGLIEPQGTLKIDEETALIIHINDVIEIRGSWNGALVTIALQHSGNPLIDTCVMCGQELYTMGYRDDKGWCCKSCTPPKVTCENRDCYYEDYPKKCEKHTLHYCNENHSCQICCRRLENGSWFTHYHSAHRNITYKSGSTWQVKYGAGGYCLLSTVAGTAVCWYKLLDSSFTLYVYVPPPGERLSEYGCDVTVTQPETGFSRNYTPELTFKKSCDWFVRITKSAFATWKKN